MIPVQCLQIRGGLVSYRVTKLGKECFLNVTVREVMNTKYKKIKSRCINGTNSILYIKTLKCEGCRTKENPVEIKCGKVFHYRTESTLIGSTAVRVKCDALPIKISYQTCCWVDECIINNVNPPMDLMTTIYALTF
ncbi:hypothetical protein ACOME3_004263 [Neoechinorhynchus agilis]